MAKQTKQTKAIDVTNTNPAQLGAVVSEKPKKTRVRLNISTEQFLELCNGAETLREIQTRAIERLGIPLSDQQINSKRAQIASMFKENGYANPFARLKGQGAPRIDVSALALKFGVKKTETQTENGDKA